MPTGDVKEHLCRLEEKSRHYKARCAALTALQEAVQPSAHFTTQEKRSLQQELDRVKKEQQQCTRMLDSRVYLYDNKLGELEETIRQRQQLIDATCKSCPDLSEHMDLCKVFVAQHEKIAHQIEKTKEAINKD
jgi:SMC interacting uncharacterized protein involved in chromosome segregation